MRPAADVVVIGAGLSGLTAGYRLQEAGFTVLVLERASRPGGRVQTIEKDGHLIDVGADAITSGYDDYLKLANDVGIGDAVAPVSPEIGIIRNDEIHTFNMQRPLSLVTTRILSWSAKLKTLRGLVTLKKGAKDLYTHSMYKKAELDDPDMTAQDLTKKLFGREAAEYFFDPVVKMYNGTSANCSSLDAYLPAAIADHKTLALKGGQAVLPETIASKLNVVYEVTVDNLAENDENVVVRYRDSGGNHHEVVADGCVLATMFDSACEIYPNLKEICSNVGAVVEPMALIKIHLAYKSPTKSKAYLVQVPDVEDPDLYCLFLEHNKLSDRVPEGRGLVTVYTSNDATHKYLDMSDEEIVEWARARVEKYMPELADHFEFSMVSRWPYMAQASYPGFYRNAATDFEKLSPDSRIQVACDIFAKGGQDTAVTWGERVAKNLIESLAPSVRGHE